MTTSDAAATSPATDGTSTALKEGVLGAPGIAFMVIAAAAPLMVMAGVAPLALSIAGAGAPAAYLGAGIAFAIFAVAFMAMTRRTGGSGAFYSYVTLGLGKHLGLGAGFVALLSYNALQIGVFGLMAVQEQDALARLFHIHISWPWLALISIVLVWAIGRRGIEVGAKLLGVLLVLESGILAVLAVSILFHVGISGIGFDSFHPSAMTTPGMAATLGTAFAAFMGFESTALYRREARDPERTIPRATYVAVGFMAIFYCFVVWAIVQGFGAANVQEAASKDIAGLFFSAMQTYVGTWASDLMSVLIVTSTLASQIAFYNAITRYTYSLANDGVLPKALGTTHPRFLSPSRAGDVQAIFAIVVVGAFALAGADPYYKLFILVNTPGIVGIIALQAITAVAVVSYLVRTRHQGLDLKGIVAGVVASIVLILSLWVLVANLDMFSMGSTALNAALSGSVLAVLIAGIIAAQLFRVRRPQVYEQIGRDHDAETAATTTTSETSLSPGRSRPGITDTETDELEATV